jgi:hypothetical protein
MSDDRPTSPGLEGAKEPTPVPPSLAPVFAIDRAEWDTYKSREDEWRASVKSGLALLQGQFVALEGDVTAARKAAEDASRKADEAQLRSKDAHVTAMGAARSLLDHDGSQEGLMSALTETRGQLTEARKQLGDAMVKLDALKSSDDQLRELVTAAAKNSVAEVLGKNPRLVAAIIGFLLVVTNIMAQRFLVSPAAPDRGAILAAPTPTVHVAPDAGGP